MDLFTTNAVHGGTWRCAFKTNSYTEVSAVIYGIKAAAPYGAGAAAVGEHVGGVDRGGDVPVEALVE